MIPHVLFYCQGMLWLRAGRSPTPSAAPVADCRWRVGQLTARTPKKGQQAYAGPIRGVTNGPCLPGARTPPGRCHPRNQPRQALCLTCTAPGAVGCGPRLPARGTRHSGLGVSPQEQRQVYLVHRYHGYTNRHTVQGQAPDALITESHHLGSRITAGIPCARVSRLHQPVYQAWTGS